MFIALSYVKELENLLIPYSTKKKLSKIIKLGKDKTKICDNVNTLKCDI